MKISNAQLTGDLSRTTRNLIAEAKTFQQLPLPALNFKTSEESWSALECIEHLNRYMDFYLPEIRKQLGKHERWAGSVFASGYLGDKFAKMMMATPKMKKIKTFKKMNPSGTELSVDVIRKFLNQQQELLYLLDEAKDKNLTRIKTSITLTRWIKFRLGDTFRFVIYHNERHILQARRAIESSDYGRIVKMAG